MQPIGHRTHQARADGISGSGSEDRGLVLPRFLRKPARYVIRLMNGGFRVSRRGMAGFGIVFALAAGIAGLSANQDAEIISASVASGFGIAIDAYQVSGNREISDLDVVTLLAPEHGTSILGYDVAGARETLKENPWIADARVTKVYPNKLAIEIRERMPFALWQNEHGLFLIDREGLVLSEYDGRDADLPLVVGKGAEKEAADMLATLQRVPEIAVQARALVRVGERRWDIETDDGVIIMLPEANQAEELVRLAKFERETELLMRDIEHIDLRFGDRVVIGLSDNARTLIREKRELQIKQMKASGKERNT